MPNTVGARTHRCFTLSADLKVFEILRCSPVLIDCDLYVVTEGGYHINNYCSKN